MNSVSARQIFRVSLSLLFFFAFMAFAPARGYSETRKIAVLPWNVRSVEGMDFLRDALVDMLTSRLGAEADISTPRADRLKAALRGNEGRDITEGTALKVGKELKQDYVLFGSVTVIGKAVSLDASLLDVSNDELTSFSSTGPSRDSIVMLVDNLSKDIIYRFHPERAAPVRAVLTPVAPVPVPIPVPVPLPVLTPAPTVARQTAPSMIIKPTVKREQRPAAPSFWKSEPIKGKFISMTAGDLDGNGVKELFLLQKTSVTIAVKEDKDIRVIQKLKAGSGLEFVSVSAVDTDGDGKVEVYISALDHFTAESFVLEYADGSYKITTKNIRWLLRKARSADGRAILLGQRFRASDGFYGGISIIKNQGGKVVRDGSYLERLPGGVNLYNFTYFNFNSRDPSELDLLAFDKEGRLLVYRRKGKGWRKEWKSKEYYGGTMHRVNFNEDTSGSETYRYVEIERPLFHMDTNGDGRDELIVRQSKSEGVFKRYAKVFKTYSGGSILSMTWDGEFLTESWRTREINGYIADFLIDDLEGKGSNKLIMIVQKDTSIFSSGPKGYLLIYDLAPSPPPLPNNPLIR